MRRNPEEPSERSSTRRIAFLATLVVSVCTIAFLAATPPMPAPSPDPVPGDLDCNGLVDLADVIAFHFALSAPDSWQEQYERNYADLLARADFNSDAALTTADIPGFAAAVRAALGPPGERGDAAGPAGAGGESLEGGDSLPEVDFDIDSDNNNAVGQPDRSSGEDDIEDESDLPGKLLFINDDDDDHNSTADKDQTGNVTNEDDLPGLILEFAPSFAYTPGTGSPTLFRYAIDYPSTVKLWKHCPRTPIVTPSTAAAVVSANTTYTHPAWIRGDTSGNGQLDNFDIDGFLLMLSDPADFASTWSGPLEYWQVGDMNADGRLNNFDVDAFVEALQENYEYLIPVYLYAEGLTPSAGNVRLVATFDSDNDATIETSDAQDAVRTTATLRETGPANRWGAELSVAPTGSVNLRTGNLTNAFGLLAVDPIGPPIGVTLYHNSLGAEAGDQTSAATGIYLGPGWTFSYSAHLVVAGSAIVLYEDDGRRWVFTDDGTQYQPEPGNFDDLRFNATSSEWELTTPAQWKRFFDNDGRLLRIQDSEGNVATVVRDGNGRLSYVKSAAEASSGENHRIGFEYDATSGKLVRIYDDFGDDWSASAREWLFTYQTGTGWLASVQLPTTEAGDRYYTFDYFTNGRLETVEIPTGDTWTYYYTSRRLSLVSDPTCGTANYTQTFSYGAYNASTGFHETTYTDRRGKVWKFGFDAAGNLRDTLDPLSHRRQFGYDAAHNRTSSTDALNHTWTATYGPVGNLLTLNSPLTGSAAQQWERTYIAPTTGQLWNFYRLEYVYDPLDHWVRYQYTDSNFPTRVTTITEQEAYTGGGTAVTTLAYYGPSEPHARGALDVVTDANGVEHHFSYDTRGFQDGLCEGADCGGIGANDFYPLVLGQGLDGSGRAISATNSLGSESTVVFDPDGNPMSVICVSIITGGPSTPRRLGEVPTPGAPPHANCLNDATYDKLGRPTNLDRCFSSLLGGGDREYSTAYDVLGRVTSNSVSHQEAGWSTPLTRAFDYTLYNPDGQLLTRIGTEAAPADPTTNYSYDDAGRATWVSRNGVEATNTYDAADRLTQVDYSNGTKTVYTYDNADRLTKIEHRNASNALLFQLDYVWRKDNVVLSRTETDATVTPNVVTLVEFEYDDRQRQTRETRTTVGNPNTIVYDIDYTYDQLGNRLTMSDTVADTITYYWYDTNVEDHPSRTPPFQDATKKSLNNRLLAYEEYADVSTTPELTRTVRYVYYQTGDVSNITIKDASDPWYRDLAFFYYTNQTVAYVIWDRWQITQGGEFDQYQQELIREFMYDSPRARFLRRDIDPATFNVIPHTEIWTDYDGIEPYLDSELAVSSGTPSLSALTRLIGGFASQTVSHGAAQYWHSDLIGSTQFTTDDAGAAGNETAYTAFGNAVATPPSGMTRYQYAGAHGYESGLLTLDGADQTAPIVLQHLGARWFQPITGRFVQRDPIGLRGGFNPYNYLDNTPVGDVDPDGLKPRLRDDPPVIHNGQVLVHWYWEYRTILGQKYTVYSHTQRFPLIINTKQTGNATADDAAEFCQKHQLVVHEAVATSTSELDRGARDVMKRLSCGGFTAGKVPVSVTASDGARRIRE